MNAETNQRGAVEYDYSTWTVGNRDWDPRWAKHACRCCHRVVAWTDRNGHHVEPKCPAGRRPDMATARRGKVVCR